MHRKKLSFIIGGEVFQFPPHLQGRYPGFYIMTNLQRWIRPVVKSGSDFYTDDRQAFPISDDQTQIDVDVVGQFDPKNGLQAA